jgi:cyclase
MQKITDNIYIETNYLCPNVGCILTGEGAVLVDSPFLPGEAKDWNKTICTLSNKNIAYLINTDHHFDHMLGNCYLTRKTIAHRTGRRGFQYYLDPINLKKEIGMFFPEYLEKWEDLFAQVEIILPQIVFSEELNLYLDDMEIQLKFVGGHSPATIWIYIPSEGVLFAGDNIENSRHPAMVFARFDTWIDLLRKVEEMKVEIIIPGHGLVGGRELATRQRQYLEEMLGLTKSLKSAGMSKEDMAPKVAEHMLAYLPVPEENLQVNRLIIMNGAMRMFDQIR